MKNCEMSCAGMSSAGLDTQHAVASIFKRLPRYMQDKFMGTVSSQLDSGQPIRFSQLSQFVQHEARVENSFLGQLVGHHASREPKQPPLSARPFRKATINAVQSQVKENSVNPPPPTSASTCVCCSLPQALWKCDKFKRQSETERRALVNEKRLCYNCLGSHVARNCRSTSKCRVCQKRHHTLLHRDANSSETKPELAHSVSVERETGAGDNAHVMSVALNSEPVDTQGNDSHDIAANALESKRQDVRLKVVPMKVWGSHGKQIEIYAFLDEGSDSWLCSERLRKQLQIQGQSVQYSLSTIKGTDSYAGLRINLSVQVLNETTVINETSVPSLPRLQRSIPSSGDGVRYSSVLHGVSLPILDGGCIDSLIGADVPEAHRTIEYRLSQSQGPNAVRSPLGWSLVGPTGQVRENELVPFNVNFVQSNNVLLHRQLQKMYNADFVGKERESDIAVSVHDRKALSIMKKSVVKVDSQHQIALPWRSGDSRLPNNKYVAEKRMACLKEKLGRVPKLRQQHREKINEYLELGYARKISHNELAHTPRTWYIPHHATGEKFRVVFDCAAKCRGTSLNDCLLQGPDQTSTLLGVLLRFRCYRIVELHIQRACSTKSVWNLKTVIACDSFGGHTVIRAVHRRSIRCSFMCLAPPLHLARAVLHCVKQLLITR